LVGCSGGTGFGTGSGVSFGEESWAVPNSGFFPWGSFVTWQQKKHPVWLIQRTFVEKNVPKLPVFQRNSFSEIAIFLKIGSSRLPKYSKLLVCFYFTLWP
jgi:hypothetical protein